MKKLCSLLFAFLSIAASAFATVTVSAPKASSTVTSPVQYTATATASSCSKGVSSMGIYVNNTLQYKVTGAKLSTSIALATGAEHTVVQEWDKCGGSTFTTVNLTVVSASKPTVTISANPTTVAAGVSSTLTVVATAASKVVLTGSDGSSYTFSSASGGTHSVTPKATTTYTATATGANSSTATAKTTVTVSTKPAPTVSITASPTSVNKGSSSTLKVTATNATAVSVKGSDGSSFTLSTTGGSKTVTPTATTTYTATATGSSGTSVTAQATVTVTQPSQPTVTISAQPTTINAGSSSTLTVNATHATAVSVKGSDGSSFTLSATGGTKSVSPSATTTYTATATGSGGTTATAQATVTVTPVAAPTVSISAQPTTILAGNSSTLTVTATNATTVKITAPDGTNVALSASGGTQSVEPSSTTTYTATATGSGSTSATATTTITVNQPLTVSISATPSTIALGNSSTLKVTATNATSVTIAGDDHSSYTLPVAGGTQSVSPTTTTNYTVTATGAGGSSATASTSVTVGPAVLSSVTVNGSQTSFAIGSTPNFTATANYSDQSTQDVTSQANWSTTNTAVATIDQNGEATGVAAGWSSVSASYNGQTGNLPIIVTINSGTGVNVLTWHGDSYRSGLNSNELSLTTNNVGQQTFGKLFTYSFNGYAYAQPLLVSGVTVNGTSRNVLYVATETDDVYAFDADNPGNGKPLWHTSLLQSGENPDNVTTNSAIYPTIGITGTPVIDPATNIMYVVSKQKKSGSTFRLNALDITTGNQVLGGPVTINASIATSNPNAANLTTSCIQRSALLLDHQNVYFGFGSCHTGWMLAYDKTSLLQSGVFNASSILNGEGQWASAGGVWMGGGGPASYGDSGSGDGSVYITTGNGPWDGQTAWSDSILKFSAPPQPTQSSGPTIMQPADWFTPQAYQYMDCADGDLAAGGLLLIPGMNVGLAGAKTGWLYLVNTSNLGQEQVNDAGALDTLLFESDLVPSFQKECDDAQQNFLQTGNYAVYGTSAYFNGSVYLGITSISQTAAPGKAPAGLRQFTLNNNQLKPSTYTAFGNDFQIRGTTPFISSNGTNDGVVWMIDQNEPLGASGYSPGTAILRAFDPNDLSNELYDSNQNKGDQPGYGIKFTVPVVANGKVYISTGTTLETSSSQTGEIDVYGLN